MHPKSTAGAGSGSGSVPLCSVTSLFLFLSLLCIFSLSLFFFISNPTTTTTTSQYLQPTPQIMASYSVKVYILDLPRAFNYGLLDKYWSLSSDSRIGSDVDNEIRKSLKHKISQKFPPYPESPLIKQYSAEYWILGDLLTPDELKKDSFAKRVYSLKEADVVFVPFFATLSAELQLGLNKGVFRKKVEENEDYQRQRMVLDYVKKSEAWQRSGGRDHVFVLTGYVKT